MVTAGVSALAIEAAATLRTSAVTRRRARRVMSAGSEGDRGLKLDHVHVGLVARIRAALNDVAPGHQRRAPGPPPGERHLIAVAVARVLNVDALAREEVRGERHARSDGREDVPGVVAQVIV